MFKTIKYISALAVIGLPFAACTDAFNVEDEKGCDTLSGTGEKTPLEMSVTLLDSYAGPKTRALNGTFEEGDELWAFIEQVKRSGEGTAESPYSYATTISSLESFTVENEAYKVTTTSGLQTGLYWDNFSSTENDIRDANNFLRVGYGFCFNGVEVSTTSFDEDHASVEWTVQDDQTDNQSASDRIRKSDLLWAGRQPRIHYNTNSFKPTATEEEKNEVILPVTYTHAMSKVTIELKLGEGYDVYTDGANAGKAKAFAEQETTPTLYANKKATANAISQTLVSTVAADPNNKITMRLAEDEKLGDNGKSNMTRVYEAIIAPTVMKEGEVLATVEVDGNKYDLKLTHALLTDGYNSTGTPWSDSLKAYSVTEGTVSTVTKNIPVSDYTAENGGITLPGVNYRLVATLKKQKIEVEAKITDWKDVYASVEGTIMFDANVVTSDVDPELKDATGSFDLWRSLTNADDASYDEDPSTTTLVDKASVFTLTGDKWVGDPTLYWLNGKTPYYFRALAKYVPTAEKPNQIESVEGSTAAEQGFDLLWAQTSKHTPKDANGNNLPHPTESGEDAHKVYEAGDPIDPRTGLVPLTFMHAMSKISFTLENDPAMPEADNLDMNTAMISIINLYNGGTIGIKDGKITDMTVTPENEPMTIKEKTVAEMQDFIVIPQSLTTFENGDPRNLAPIFYSAVQLTGIYADGSSLGTGTPENYYLTTELTPVGAVYYTEEDLPAINTHNAELDGAISTSTIKEPAQEAVLYTYQTFNESKKFIDIPEDLFERDGFPADAKVKEKEVAEDYFKFITEFIASIKTSEEYESLPESFRLKTAEVKYSQEEISAAKEIVDAADYVKGTNTDAEAVADKTTDDTKTEATYFTYEEFKESVNHDHFQTALTALDNQYKIQVEHKDAVLYSYDEFIELEAITSEQYTALSEWSDLPEEFKYEKPHKDALYYEETEVNEFNSTLPGALRQGDVKTAAHYVLPDNSTLTPHTPNELVTQGNKIMLYITFPDGTRYSAELSACTDGTTKLPVTEWKPGEHYHYTVTLGKETIKFRALVKDWVVRNTTGNATLDWD